MAEASPVDVGNRTADPATVAGVLLIPGLAGTASEVDAQAAHLAGRTVLVLDPPTNGEGVLDAQVQRALTAIDHGGAARWVAVGHSAGGIVALELARRHPDRVAGLVLLDSPVLVPRAVRAIARLLGALLRTPLARPLLRRFFIATFTDADTPELRAEVLARLEATPIDVARATVGFTFGHDSGPALASLTVPTVVVRANVPTRLDRLPPGVEGVEIGGVGHWVHRHAPDAVNVLLDRVLAAVEVEVVGG